jgi:hypothetical protein
MLNNSRRLLNSSSVEIYNKDIKSNGKPTCFICRKDHYEEPHSLDYFIYNTNTSKLSSRVKGGNPTDSHKASIIKPCGCNKVSHWGCLIRYISTAFTYKCNLCNTYFNLHYINKTGGCMRKVTNFILICILVIIHLGLFASGIILVIKEYFIAIYYFWQIILAIGIIIVNSLVLFYTSRYILNRLRYKQYDVRVASYTGSEKKDNNELTSFSKFLEYKYDCDKLELMERHLIGTKYEDYLRGRQLVAKYYNESNNCYYIHKSEARLKHRISGLSVSKEKNTSNKLLRSVEDNNNIVLIRQQSERIELQLPESVLKKEGEILHMNTIQEKDSEIGGCGSTIKITSAVERNIRLQVQKTHKSKLSNSKVMDLSKHIINENSIVNCESVVESEKLE